MKYWGIYLLFTSLLSAAGELDYYRENLQPPVIPRLADTLFEKTVWRRKVSHLVLEESGSRYYVTLLMMERWPHNYKGQNYPIKYSFNTIQDAIEKFHWLDSFLERNGVLRVKIHGDIIISEKILYPGENYRVRQAHASGAVPGR